MNRMVLNIDIPVGVTVDKNQLTAMATRYVQHYVYMMQDMQQKRNVRTTEPFRKMRGIINSDKPYKNMVEEALSEKYDV